MAAKLGKGAAGRRCWRGLDEGLDAVARKEAGLGALGLGHRRLECQLGHGLAA